MKKHDKHYGVKLTDKEYEDIGRRLEEVFLTGYSKPNRLLWMSFVKGIGYGFGIFIGGTIVVGIVFWILGQFNQVPVLSPFIEKIVYLVNNVNTLPPL